MKEVGTLRIGDQGPSIPLLVEEEVTLISNTLEIKEFKGHPPNSGMEYSIPVEYRDPESEP